MPQSRCPVCNRPTDQAYRPFCSKRCADVDLQRWFSGGYVVGGAEDEDSVTRPAQEDDPD